VPPTPHLRLRIRERRAFDVNARGPGDLVLKLFFLNDFLSSQFQAIIMAGIVTNIISNSLSGFVSGAVTTAGGYAGDAVGGIGNLIEGAGASIGNSEFLDVLL
jgi:hypothetical protein